MNFLRRRWLGWNLRKRREGDGQAIKRLYRLRDPWGLDTPEEHFRFRETSRVIKEKIGEHFDCILEIGCGEGLQTEYLAPLAGSIMGIDPSPLAIQRAQTKEIAHAVFKVGELKSFSTCCGKRFDLIIACEVLYYMEDLQQAFQKMNALGDSCLVSYYQGVYDRLDPFFLSKGLPSALLRTANREWRVLWWRN